MNHNPTVRRVSWLVDLIGSETNFPLRPACIFCVALSNSFPHFGRCGSGNPAHYLFGIRHSGRRSRQPSCGKTQYDITGGIRPGNGTNLFHSFGQFGVPTNNIANFLNDSGLATSNILGRVTGGNPSNIFGAIQTTGFGAANLFLMNPAGIVFGPNASLNVGGSASFTTADYLRLSDGTKFTAIPRVAGCIHFQCPCGGLWLSRLESRSHHRPGKPTRCAQSTESRVGGG